MTDQQSQEARTESVGPPGHVSPPGPAVPYTPPPAAVLPPAPVAQGAEADFAPLPAAPSMPQVLAGQQAGASDSQPGLQTPGLLPHEVAGSSSYVPPPAPVELDRNAIVSPIGGPDAPTLAEIEQYFALDSSRPALTRATTKSVRRAITLNLLVPGVGSAWIGETKRGAVLFMAAVLASVAALLSTPMILAGFGVSIYAVFEAHAGAERHNAGGLPRDDLNRNHTILIIACAAALILAPAFS